MGLKLKITLLYVLQTNYILQCYIVQTHGVLPGVKTTKKIIISVSISLLYILYSLILYSEVRLCRQYTNKKIVKNNNYLIISNDHVSMAKECECFTRKSR